MLKEKIKNHLSKSLKISGVAGSMIGLILGGNQLYDLYKKKSIENLEGMWTLQYNIENTQYNKYKGLNISYKINLTQSEGIIKGDGEKYEENGISSKTKSTIEINGTNNGDSVILNIKEYGLLRTSHCRSVLKKVKENRYAGKFEWTAASSNGVAILER